MSSEHQDDMVESVGDKERRKMDARRRGERKPWFGLGMFGQVGWTVVLPILAGLLVGIWLDAQWPDGLPWTLILLLVGTLVGCINAWVWLRREQKHIEEERDA